MMCWQARLTWCAAVTLLLSASPALGQAARESQPEVAVAPPVETAKPADAKLLYPIIRGYGGVVHVPGGEEPPRSGAKVVLDVTAGGPPEQINKGLERAARLLNLYGAAGLKASDVQLTLVVHGNATGAVLSDAGYQRHFDGARNPNLALLAALRKAGVELYVCGQALHYKGYASDQVEPNTSVAVSALNVIINRQNAGFAYVPVP